MDSFDPHLLSPSRASEFKNCPQRFKYRVVDKLPDPSGPAGALGSLVHLTLERLYLLQPEERSEQTAIGFIDDCWQLLMQAEDFSSLEVSPEQAETLPSQARELVANYFRLEDPSLVSAQDLEWWVEHETSGFLLRGIIDRVEVDENGDWILSDYKTGRAPSDNWAPVSFFGLKFYALVCWRAFGRMPKELRLVYLKEPEVITLKPTHQMLVGLERQMLAVGTAIERAFENDDWRPRPNVGCTRCPHQSICPAWSQEAAAAQSNVPASQTRSA